jgi:hypothetical protein
VVVAAPDTGAGDEIGMSARVAGATSPIPGGLNHVTNAPTAKQSVPIPISKPEHGGLMAHGVPPDAHTFRERSDVERGPNSHKPPTPKYAPTGKTVTPIPVSIVEPAWGDRALRTLAADTFTVPAAGVEAIRIAGRDHARSHICLLVETAAGAGGAAPTGIRIDHEVGNLDVGKGALIRSGAVSYLKLDCNDEMFAVSNDGSACTLSVIYLYGIAGAG